MVAAEAVAVALQNGRPAEPVDYEANLRASWVWQELTDVRNIRPAFAKFGMWGGLAYSAIDTYVLKGRAPWTFHSTHPDNASLLRAGLASRIVYPKPDGVLTFDRLSSVFISNTNHEENQPGHLHLHNPDLAISVNWQKYRSPETRYCPAGVYEIVDEETTQPKLQINAQNCVHCKTCDIKDPLQNIDGVTPEGGGGPNYPGGM
jgi:electron-transferring-flavoprotein dehydrogenase